MMERNEKRTREAFEEMIHTRGIYKALNLNPNTVRGYRIAHKKGGVTIDKMHELLTRAGWQVVQEELWRAGE